MSRTATLLLVEDDEVASGFLADNLAADGYSVLTAHTLSAAQRLLATRILDLAVIDLSLPDGDGLELLRAVRGADGVVDRVDPDLPLIVVSGRGSDVERLRGYERGCDEYVVKPVFYPELRARIEVLLRRRTRTPGRGRVRVGPIELDARSRQAWLEGAPLKLSSKEFSLLRVLVGDPSRAFSREELLREVWGFETPCQTRTVDSHASRLRKKLAGGGDRFVINVWGIGYRLLDPTLR